ncbi:MAG TPA: hypothetical protein V6D17_15725 [Candidatus Obscuribacterales bacterium]
MADIVSKTCSDYLRECYSGLKASHARELVAAFFGYKSHAALLADKRNSVEFLDVAAVLVPDSSLVDDRRRCLNDLCEQLPPSGRLVDDLVQFIEGDELFTGEVWDCFDIGEYVMEEYLPAHLSPELDLELEDLTKPLNAFFEEISYDDCQVKETDYGVRVTVSGTYSGYWLDDNDDLDDPVIDLQITVYLPRCAGRISFEEPQIDVIGTLREDPEEEEDDEESEEPAAAFS